MDCKSVGDEAKGGFREPATLGKNVPLGNPCSKCSECDRKCMLPDSVLIPAALDGSQSVAVG